jgi:hypothetical protein
VLLSVAAAPADAEALRAVSSELLERLALRIELRRVERIELQEIRQPPPGSGRYFARAWVAFAPSGGARLYLEHGATDRVLVRDVNDDAHNPELVREELGHILQSALEGLRAGEPIGAPRREALRAAGAEPEAPLPAPRAAARPAARVEHQPQPLRFGPRYELVWLGHGARFEDGPAAVFGLTQRSVPRLGLELGGYLRRPLRIETKPVGARLQSGALTALLSIEAWRGSHERLRVTAGAEAAFVRVSPFAVTDPSGVTLARSRWLKLALGRLALTYAHDLGSHMAFEFTLGAELDPSGTRYVYQGTTGEVRVLTPWPIRPLAALGVTVP